jgi:hypothetical protein
MRLPHSGGSSLASYRLAISNRSCTVAKRNAIKSVVSHTYFLMGHLPLSVTSIGLSQQFPFQSVLAGSKPATGLKQQVKAFVGKPACSGASAHTSRSRQVTNRDLFTCFAESVVQRWRPRFETVRGRGTVGAGLGLTCRVVRGSRLPGMRGCGSNPRAYRLLPRFPQ